MDEECAWDECPGHEWYAVDSDDAPANHTTVRCVHCGMPGERSDDDGFVFWPAT